MQLTINHGTPNSSFFTIAIPKKGYDEPRVEGLTKIVLKDETEKKEIICIYHGAIDIPVTQLQYNSALARLAYGVKADYLKEKMLEKYPELCKPDAIVEFWILKRV